MKGTCIPSFGLIGQKLRKLSHVFTFGQLVGWAGLHARIFSKLSFSKRLTLRYFHVKYQGDSSRRSRDIPFLKVVRTMTTMTTTSTPTWGRIIVRDGMLFRRGQKVYIPNPTLLSKIITDFFSSVQFFFYTFNNIFVLFSLICIFSNLFTDFNQTAYVGSHRPR